MRKIQETLSVEKHMNTFCTVVSEVSSFVGNTLWVGMPDLHSTLKAWSDEECFRFGSFLLQTQWRKYLE